MNPNVVWHKSTVSSEDRKQQNGHAGCVVWLTGLPSSGKSTIAYIVEEKLFVMGCRAFVLDGDNVRHGLCSDLAFSPEDRTENIRRIGETAKLFIEAGMIVLTSFISPFRADRERVKKLVGEDGFIEIFCDCPLPVCEERDPKDHYRKARSGLIQHFTGVSAPYERPMDCNLTLKTNQDSPEECAEQVVDLLVRHSMVQLRSFPCT